MEIEVGGCMGVVLVAKGEDGKLVGFGEKGSRAWAKFLRRVADMGQGELMTLSWREPRSVKHHRLFFAKLHALFDRQEAFDSEDKLRAWLTVGAGYCDYRPGQDGVPVAIPTSIAFDELDEADFAELHVQVDKFLWGRHAQSHLWPHLSAQQRYDNVDQLMLEFS